MLCKTSKFLLIMSQNRLETLFSFLQESPNDPFTKYCIALEYEKVQAKEAVIYFEDLLQNHPDYLGTYYSAGKYYENLEEFDKAASIFTKGIALAKSMNDHKASGELQTALDLL